nr:ATP synthase F0 subunit 8 [Archotermopsis wroughtoni]
MPQMMPLSWLALFMMFSTTLIMFNITNYFSQSPSKKITSKKQMKLKQTNWKW